MRKPILSIALIVGLALPMPAVAVGRLTVEDTIAGLETRASLDGFASSTSLVLHVVTPSGENISLSTRTDSRGSALVSIHGSFLEEAGQYHAFVTRGGMRDSSEAIFAVLPDRISNEKSTLEADTTVLRADGVDEVLVTVTLSDDRGNPHPGRLVELIAGRAADEVTALDRETDERGSQRFAVRTRQAGEISLRAMDLLSGVTLTQSLHILAQTETRTGQGTGGPQAAHSPSPYAAQLTAPPRVDDDMGPDDGAMLFKITLNPPQPTVGDVADLTVTAIRGDGTVAVGYVREATITDPQDPDAKLPGFGTLLFQKPENGKDRCLQCVSFSKPGKHTLVVEDALPSGILLHGELEVDVLPSAEYEKTHKIEIISHRDGGKINSENIVLEGIGPKLANLLITGGLRDIETDTDSKGFFSVPIELDPTYNEYTLRVQSMDERDGLHAGPPLYDSGPLHLVIDNTGPEKVDFVFDPERPVEGQDTMIIVQSEPDLAEVTLTLADQTITLSADPNAEDRYGVIFQAPPAGDYQPTIAAIDTAGNRREIRGLLRVFPHSLPRVQNLKVAAARETSIDLSWDPVEGEVTAYVVFWGTDPGALSSTNDTTDPSTTLSIPNLQPGTRYYFAVSPRQEDRVGDERSDTISASTLGLQLTATPGVNMVTLEWTLAGDMPVSEYTLQFDDRPGEYEHRREHILAARPNENGVRKQIFPVKDLIGGIPYHFRITGFTVTGQPLELTATADATPLKSDSHQPTSPGNDGIGVQGPGDAQSLPDSLHSGAPTTPGSGLPAMMLLALAIVSAVVFFSKRRSARLKTEAFLRQMQRHYQVH